MLETRRTTTATVAVGAVLLLGSCSSTSSSTPHVGAPTATVSSSDSGTSADPMAAEIASIKEALAAAIAAHAFPGAVVVVRRGHETRTLVVGEADRARHTPMRSADRFRIGSVTKTMVAATTLRLVAQHRLTLQDTVDHWLPGFLAHGREITVAELLGQTSGLPEYATLPGYDPLLRAGDDHPRAVLGLIVDKPLLWKPGTRTGYSNSNYTTLGLILERVTHRPLSTVMQQQLFGPLHMRSTTLAPVGLFRPPIAHGYYHGRDVIPGYEVAWAGGAGAVVSTAHDVATFFDHLYAGDVVPSTLLRAMERMRPMRGTWPYTGYGLGLASIQTECGTAIGHGGSLPGYLASEYATRNDRRSVVYVVNTSPTHAANDAIVSVISSALCLP